MHLNKLLEQIKRHQSPTEAIDKLATALEKHEGSLLEKGFTILKSELAANMYEAINGPHFDEASGASLPVFISVSGSVSTASNTHNIPLVNASSAPITGSQVSAGNRYIAYFNKCDNVIQLMSYTPAAPTPAA